MDATRWDRIHQIFSEALELEAAARDEHLARRCAGDAELRSEVESLLLASEAADEYFGDLADRAERLSDPALAEELSEEATVAGSGSESSMIGRQIGPYRVLRQLGAGGMGTVFLAERATEEYRQEVALKLLATGSTNPEIRRRFLEETRILARLEHPGIARFIDAGVTEGGRPYYAMERVLGQSMLEYCDDRELTLEARLRLFLDICEPVRHAHAQLIVHRDIKPGNIFVTPEGHVKLLDFGIAKALDPEGDAHRTRTMPFFTPAYASPEQARGELATTLSDVYSLGVVLYELVTGHRPYELSSRTPAEIQQIVCEYLPNRPSEAFARASARQADGRTGPRDAEEVARLRSTTPDRLRRRVAGDLDFIILKALAKKPSQRYESVSRFADDLRRHLEGRPVLARPDSLPYRIRKFTQRHRVAVAAAALTVASVVAGTGATIWQARRASDQARIASAEAETAKQAAAFMADIFRLSDPGEAGGDTVTVRHMLDVAAERLQTELADQPRLQAELLTEIAGRYRNLGLLDRGVALVRRAIALEVESDADDLAISESRSALGDLLADQGKGREAIAEYERVLAIRAETPFPDSLKAHVQVNLAWELRDQARYDEAARLFRSGLEIQRALHGEAGADVMSTYMGLVAVLHDQGSLEAADSLFEVVMARQDTTVGRPHPLAADALMSMGLIRRLQDRYAEAAPLVRLGLDMHLQLYDRGHPDRVSALNEWGSVLYQLGRLGEATEVLEGAIREADAALGRTHPLAVSARDRLGLVLAALGRHERAMAIYDSIVPLKRERFGDDHAETLATTIRSAQPRLDFARTDEAEPLLLGVLERAGPESYRLQALEGLGRVQEGRGELDSALALYDRAIAIGEAGLRDNHRLLQDTRRRRAAALIELGQGDEAADLLAGVLEVERATRPSPHYRTGATLILLARVELLRGNSDGAAGLLREALTELAELPPEHGLVRQARRLLSEPGAGSG